MKKLYFVYLLLLCQLGLAQTQQAPVYRPDDSLKATSTAKRVSMLLSPATTVSAVARPVDPIEFFPPEDPYPPGNPLPPDNPLPPPGSPAPPVNTSDSFHDTRGNIEVNGGGQLQFTLPVALPPGVKTVAPQINLVYTSGSGNGIAGYGWSLSGITAISRVGRNIEKDGEVRGIQLDYTDYYSFNGQRLILKSGVYGKDGAEYVTEKFSNVKIKSLGAILGQQWQGPEYWEVTFEDGSQAWYGATGTGAGNGRTPVEYNIVKWRDAQGNYISYQYSLSNNVAVVSSITWGGNEDLGKPHFNEITYTYKNRQLKEMSFVQGVKFVQNLILDKITVNTNGSLFKEYQLTYKITDGTSRYEIPESIIEKNSAGIAARPVTFKNSAAHNQIIKQQVANNLSSPNQYVYGDFNGDGRIDALHYSSGYPATELCLREDNNGYCEEYETVPGLSPGTYITYNKLNNSTDAVKVSDENLSKGIASNFLDNGEVVGRSTITVKNVGADGINFKTYVVKNEVMVLISQSVVPKSVYDHTTQYVPPPRSYEPYSTTTTTLGTFKEIDVNGDGISELLFSTHDRVCYWDVDDNGGPINKSTKTVAAADEVSRPPLGWSEECYNYHKIYLHDITNQLTYGIAQQTDKDFLQDAIMMDFDGDGVADLVENKNNSVTYQKFSNNGNGRYVLRYGGGYNFNGESKGLLFGDFNGDGKMDFIVPEKGSRVFNWRLYTNTGKTFEEQYISNFSEYTPENYTVNSGYHEQHIINHFAKDINGDGKDDVIRVESRTYRKHKIGQNRDSELRLRVIVSAGADFAGKQIFSTAYEELIKSTWEEHYYPINISYRLRNIDQFLIINHGPAYESYSFYNAVQNTNLNEIEQGGLRTDVSFVEMDAGNAQFSANYVTGSSFLYPYGVVRHLPNKLLVAQLRQGERKQDFKYKDLLYHLQGRGMIGFRQTARSSWYTDQLAGTKIWSGAEMDPLQDGVPVKEWSIQTTNEQQVFPADLSENNTQLLSFKSTAYRFDKMLNGDIVNMAAVAAIDRPNVVTATVPVKSVTKDFTKEVRSETTIWYDQEEMGPVTQRFYLPTRTVHSVNNNFAVSTTNLKYAHNNFGTGREYYVGRPVSKTELVEIYGDTKGSAEEYIYKDHLLETLVTYNRDNSGGFREKYAYDGWGNVIEKTVSRFITGGMAAMGDTKKDKALYDPQGRFVVKKTDNLGLETNVTYNDWGQVLSQKDPMGVVLANTYDAWGKLLTTGTNLSGTATYQYSKDTNGDAIVTERAGDGTEKIAYTNRLGQNYLNKSRKFGAGQYVSVMTLFDALGRKTAESEPYAGAAWQWNTIEYDLLSRPVKAVSFTGKIMETSYHGRTVIATETNAHNRFKKQTADPVGNIISTEDLGGTISFKFNAAGENIEANYEGNIVKTSYDAWGNTVRFEDPSNGTYKYEYNGFMGALSKAISPKGEKNYRYNSLGQLVSQSEASTEDKTTDKEIAFTYNSKGLLTGKSGTSLGNIYSSGVTYDTYGRTVSSFEDSNGRSFRMKNVAYDEYMRIASYEKELQSSAGLTSVAIQHEYDAWSGTLFRVREKHSGRILWQLNEVNDKGQVTQAKLGNVNITNTYAAHGFLANINHAGNSGNTVLQVGYNFDAIKNELQSRTTGGDFNILEQFRYDSHNRLYNWTDPVTGVFTENEQRNVYDNKGRITQNDQLGIIRFDNGTKKYQATGVVLNQAGTQNYTNDLIQKISYNENNDPFRIDGVRGDVAFEYGLTSMRQRVTYGGNFDEGRDGKFTKYYSEDGSYEVIRNNQTGQEKHLMYIGGSPYESNIVFVKGYTESSGSFKFLHKDYLGSVLAITDEAGTKLEQRHFDAWGQLTHLKIGSNATVTDKEQIRNYLSDGNLIVDRGYTSHEHFAEVGLIHMNGRLYDPLLRRFLNADENIQDPHNTQNYNKYGYVLNNPLMYNDPSGEIFFLIPLVGYFWSAVIVGAAIGLASYSLGVAIAGQKWNFGSALKSMFFGAVGGAATFGIGSIFSNTAGTITTLAQSIKDTVGGVGLAIVQAGTHAVSQGVLGLMQGQSFISGAAAGFLGSLGAAGWGEMVGSKFAGSAVGQITFGALSGGIGAELTGGNFWYGALAGGMVAGLNHAMHSIDSPFADDGDGGGKRRNTGENRDARHHKPAPKDLDGFPDAERVPNKGRARWKNPDGKILEWDKQHGDVEVYNKNGKHLGSARPKTGELYKPPVSGRRIDPIIKVGTGAALIYGGMKVLDWAASRLTPMFMTPIMMYQINPNYQPQQQFH